MSNNELGYVGPPKKGRDGGKGFSLGDVFARLDSFTTELEAEGLSLEQYLAERKASIVYLEKRIKLYEKLAKEVKSKKVSDIFKADANTMRTAIASIKSELEGVLLKMEAIGELISKRRGGKPVIDKERLLEARKLLKSGGDDVQSK